MEIIINSHRRVLHPVRWAPPFDEEAWEGAWFFGDDAEASARNLIAGKADAAVIGAPVVSDDWMEFSGANYLQTEQTGTVAGALVCIGKSDDTLADAAHRPMFMSNYQGPAVDNPARTSGGASLYTSNGTQIMGSAAKYNSSLVTPNAGNVAKNKAISGWSLYIMAWDATGTNLYDMTAATVTSLALGAGYAQDPASSAFRIGSSPTQLSYGKSQQIFAGILNRAPTLTERNGLYALLKDYCATVGVVI